MAWLEWIARRSSAVLLAGLLLIALGAYLAFRIDRRDTPSLTPPTIVVTSLSPTSTLEDMRDTVTLPQEKTLADLGGLTRLRSVTRQGVSILAAEFAYGTDLERARTEVSARVAQVPLPAEALSLQVAPFGGGDFRRDPLMLLALSASSSETGLESIGVVARQEVLPMLLGVAGVQSARLLGEERLQVQVDLDPAKLRSTNISFEQVSALIRFNNVALSTGTLKTKDQEVPITTFNELTTVQELENLVVGVAGFSGRVSVPVRLRDVGKVHVVPAPDAGRLWMNGRPAVGIQVFARDDADPIATAKAVRRAVEEVAAGLDPGLTLLPVVDNTEHAKKAIAGIEWQMLIGAGAALSLVAVLLFSLRTALVVALSVAAALSAGIAITYLAGLPLNPSTGAGLAFALALAFPPVALATESAWRRAREGEQRLGAPWSGVRQVALTCVALQVAALVALLPLAFVDGAAGIALRLLLLPLAATSLASLVVALTLTPALTQQVLTWAGPGSLHGPGRWLRLGAGWLASLGLKQRVAGTIVAVVGFGGSFALLPLLSLAFLSQPPGNQLIVELFTEPRATLEQKLEALQAAQKALESVQGVAQVTSGTGNGTEGLSRPALRDPLRPQPDATLMVTFATEGAGDERAQQLQAALDGMKEATAHVFPIATTDNRAAFRVSLLTAEPANLQQPASQLAEELEQLPGVSNLLVTPLPPQPAINVEADPQRAFSAGMGTFQLGRQVRQMVQGELVTQVRLDGSTPIGLWLRMDPALVKDVDGLRSLPVGSGEPAPLTALAAVEEAVAPVEVLREDSQFATQVTGTLVGQPGVDAARQIEAIADQLQALPGVTVRLSGLPPKQLHDVRWLFVAPAVSAGLVAAAAALLTGPVPAALLALAGIGLASLGALVALAAFGRPLDLGALAGLVLLPSLASSTALIWATAVRRLRARGLPLRDALPAVAQQHTLGVLLAAWPPVFALMPLAVGFLESGPVATGAAGTLAGGAASAAFLGLVCLPAIYALFGGAKTPSRAAPPPPNPPPAAPPPT